MSAPGYAARLLERLRRALRGEVTPVALPVASDGSAGARLLRDVMETKERMLRASPVWQDLSALLEGRPGCGNKLAESLGFPTQEALDFARKRPKGRRRRERPEDAIFRKLIHAQGDERGPARLILTAFVELGELVRDLTETRRLPGGVPPLGWTRDASGVLLPLAAEVNVIRFVRTCAAVFPRLAESA